MASQSFSRLSEISVELKKLSSQFICPKDTFFASMAALVDRAQSTIRSLASTAAAGFITCISSPDEPRFTVVAKFRTLEDAQAFYSALVVDLPKTDHEIG